MTDLGAITPTEPTRQQLAAQGRSAPGKVTGKIKTAIDAMVWQGLKRDEAATAAGLTDHGLYVALSRPHVRAYYLGQCEVLRTSGRARRIHRLEQIAEQDDNKQAAVNAIKALDYQEDQPAAARIAASAPGLVLVIDRTGAALTAHQPSIEAKPLELQADVSQPTNEHD